MNIKKPQKKESKKPKLPFEILKFSIRKASDPHVHFIKVTTSKTKQSIEFKTNSDGMLRATYYFIKYIIEERLNFYKNNVNIEFPLIEFFKEEGKELKTLLHKEEENCTPQRGVFSFFIGMRYYYNHFYRVGYLDKEEEEERVLNQILINKFQKLEYNKLAYSHWILSKSKAIIDRNKNFMF